MKANRLLPLSFFFIGVLLIAAAPAEPFTMVEGGAPASAIVVSRWTDRVEHTAAMRLRDCVLRMTGAELPILTRTYPDGAFLANWQIGRAHV